MNRAVIALAVLGLAGGSAGVASATPGNGNGAVKSGLAPKVGVSPAVCGAATAQEAGKQTENGFVVLNAPGKPAKGDQGGPQRKLIGEVALKGAEADATYRVFLSDSAGQCGVSVGSLVTNEQGNGNLSFQQSGKGAGTWNIVLTRPLVVEGVPLDVQRYASAPVTVT